MNDIFKLFLSGMFVVMGIDQGLKMMNEFRATKNSANLILEIIEKQEGRKNDEGNKINNVKGEIIFEDVSFRYKS